MVVWGGVCVFVVVVGVGGGGGGGAGGDAWSQQQFAQGGKCTE